MIVETIKLVTILNETVSGETAQINTGEAAGQEQPDCRFYIDVTGITGTSMLVEIVTTINGIDFVLGAFAAVTGVVKETLVIPQCPAFVKFVYTETLITDFDATIHSSRAG